VFPDAQVFRFDDLVGRPVLEDAVLVDAGGMGKGVGADDGLVGLDRDVHHTAHEPAGAENFLDIDIGMGLEDSMAGLEDHDDFFQGGVPGSFPDPVDGAFHLIGPILDRGQAVGDGKAQIVVTVYAQDHVIQGGHPFFEPVNEVAEFVRNGVSDRIGDVDNGCSRLDGAIDDPAQVVEIRAGRILCRVLHVLTIALGVAHRFYCHLQGAVPVSAQFFLEVDVGGPEKRMDARSFRPPNSFPGNVNVFLDSPCQAGNYRSLHHF